MTPPTFFPVAEAPFLQEVLGAIGIPDVDILGGELTGIGRTTHKPQQLFGHTPPKHTLGCQQGKLVPQAEPVSPEQ